MEDASSSKLLRMVNSKPAGIVNGVVCDEVLVLLRNAILACSREYWRRIGWTVVGIADDVVEDALPCPFQEDTRARAERYRTVPQNVIRSAQQNSRGVARGVRAPI
jgi:hypothetical protein